MKFEPLWALVAGAEDKGNIPLAIRFATQLIELEDSVEARMARARLLAMISEIRAAISDLTHAMSKQPENLEALFARAHCFLAERVFELAEADFERGIGIDPKNKYFLDAYARCLARQTSDSAIVLAFEAPFGVLLEQRCQTREPQEITEARLCEDDSAADYAPSAPALGPIANDSLPAGVSYWRPGPPDEPDPYDESLEPLPPAGDGLFPIKVLIDPKAFVGMRIRANIELEIRPGEWRRAPLGDGLDSMIEE